MFEQLLKAIAAEYVFSRYGGVYADRLDASSSRLFWTYVRAFMDKPRPFVGYILR